VWDRWVRDGFENITGQPVNNTWSHAAARACVRPLVGTFVRPNHITFVRLASGALACILLAKGGRSAELWSGLLWIVSAFLDRADGELARIGKMQSRRGHLFDYYTDVSLNSAFFLAAGINVRHGILGAWAIVAGSAACLAMVACCLLAEAYETEVATGERVFEGGWGFQPDDALYLLPVFVWLHWLTPVVIAAALVTTAISFTLLVRYVRLHRHLAAAEKSAHRASPTPAVAAPAPSACLTDEQLGHFAEKGWVASPGFFSASDAVEISTWIDDLTRRPERPGREMVYHERRRGDPGVSLIQRIENFCPFHDELDRLVHGRLMSAVEALLGAPAVLFKDKINFKMAGGAGFEWHQDQQAGWSVYAPFFITAMVSIDPASVENGCLEVADAPRLHALIGEEWKPLSAEQMRGYSMVPIISRAGDVVFFDSFVPHGSEPNRTERDRRVLYLTYNARAHGDQRQRYFADKRASFPPDIERKPGTEYRFRV